MDRKDQHHEISRLENTLKELPKVEDHRSKEFIYEQIKARMEEKPKRSFKGWVTPVFASAAVILLLITIAPSMMNNNNLMSTEETAEDANMSMVLEADKALEEENNEMNMFSDIERIEGDFLQYMGAARKEYLAEGDRIVTIPYTEANAQYVIPLSFIVNDEKSEMEQVKEIVENYQGEQVGVGISSLVNVSFEEINESEVLVDIPSEKVFVGTAEVEMLIQSIQSLFSKLGYEVAHLTMDGVAGVPLGNYGDMETLALNGRAHGYFLHTTPNNYSFLVPAKNIYYPFVPINPEELSFSEILEQMRNSDPGIGYEATIPEDIDFTIETGKVDAKVIFNHHPVFEDPVRTTIMIDAILLTAKDFALETVEFEVSGLEYLGPYPTNEPISVELGINMVFYQ